MRFLPPIPDLVIAAVPYQQAAVAEILKAGVRFLGLAPRTLADIYTDIAMIAAVVSAADRAAELSRICRKQSKTFVAALPAFHSSVSSAKNGASRLITSQCWVAELIDAAGGVFMRDPANRFLPKK